MTNREAAIKIIRRLRKGGFEALLAGGCVRDMLLHRQAKDYDVVTNALPGEVIKLFRRTHKIGAKFGVVMVIIEQQRVEVATFRMESGYADGRHPANVEFSNAKKDAGRRDFTINGMFYDPIEKKFLDYVNGRRDLDRKILRTIGAAHRRFGEDYLRMLRAVRFSTELAFILEPHTWSAIRKHASNITKISSERIAMELEAILTNPNRASGAYLLAEAGLAEAVFPGFVGSTARFGLEVLGRLRKKVSFPLALACFFAGCDAKFAAEKCRFLKLSRIHTKHLRFLLSGRARLLDDRMPLAQFKLLLSEPYFWDLYEMQRAVQKARGHGLGALAAIRKRAAELKGTPLRPRPLLDGHELIGLGARPGSMVGLLAEEMYIAQLSEHITTSAQARRWVADWLGRHERLEQ